jgi:hypothetical protein
VAVGSRVLVEVGSTTGLALTGAHALRISTISKNEIDLNPAYVCMSRTALQDTLPLQPCQDKTILLP